MRDEPQADVDPAEFAPDTALTEIEILPEGTDGVPTELMAEPNTDPHTLEHSAEFAAGLEVGRAQGERDGYARGLAAGREEGRAAGLAEQTPVRLQPGIEYAFDGIRRALIAVGSDATMAFLEMSRLRDWLLVNPPRSEASEGAPSGPRSDR